MFFFKPSHYEIILENIDEEYGVGGKPVFFQMSYRTELGKSSRGGNFQNVTLVEPYPAFQLSFVLFVCCFLVL